jgi:hypothetical protein
MLLMLRAIRLICALLCWRVLSPLDRSWSIGTYAIWNRRPAKLFASSELDDKVGSTHIQHAPL